MKLSQNNKPQTAGTIFKGQISPGSLISPGSVFSFVKWEYLEPLPPSELFQE